MDVGERKQGGLMYGSWEADSVGGGGDHRGGTLVGRGLSWGVSGFGRRRSGRRSRRAVGHRRTLEPADAPDDDPVVAGGVLGLEVALDRRRARRAGQRAPAKRSAPRRRGAAREARRAARRATWMAKRRRARIRRHVSECATGQNETSGGSSETAANELTISPSGVLSTSAVTNATPVAKRPNAARSSVVEVRARLAAWAVGMAHAGRGRGRERRRRGGRRRGWRRAGA